MTVLNVAWYQGLGVGVFAAILILYLTTWLNLGSSTATSIFHAFVVLCYFSPLLGAIIADGYLGKYRSVLNTANSIPFYLNQATWPIHTHTHRHKE